MEEPESNFLGHVTTATGTKKDIVDTIITFIQSNPNNKHLLNISLIGCDETVVNTEANNGVITLLQNLLGRELQC